MTREQLEAVYPWSARANGLSSNRRHLDGIEDYLFINGDQLPVRQAAERLGVTERTISRYRATLRRLAGAR